MAAHPPSYTPKAGGIYTVTTPSEVLVSKDPVFVRKDVINGRYIGKKPYNYLPLAIVMCVLNPLVGPIALVFSVMSDRAYFRGDLRYAQKWAGYAFTACIITFIVSTILYIAIGFSLSAIGTRGGHMY